MRYRGNRRQSELSTAAERGRHRRPKETSREPGRTPEAAVDRPRRLQPRDALGRFRKVEPADRPVARPAGDAVPDERAKPRYTWRDFELDEDLPRAAPHPPGAVDVRDGRRHCGALEGILYRQWAADGRSAPPDAVRAVDSLAGLPDALKDRLAEALDGIYVGSGGVPDLDDMQYLRGAPLPSGQATWDICAGAYGDRKIVVGDRPSPTPDVMLHEVGHALDDIDGRFVEDGSRQWQSDSAEFRALYEQCVPHFASDFHIQPGDLGRHEFFADAFAAIASRQRPALVDMLGGNTRAALNVMLFFDRKYGI
jgi:hypothetical protein